MEPRNVNLTTPPVPFCDFCSAQPVTWRYECPSAQIAHLPLPDPSGTYVNSVGDWAACDICADHIQHKRWRSMHTRSTFRFLINNPDAPLDIIDSFIRKAHLTFQQNFTGRRTPHQP